MGEGRPNRFGVFRVAVVLAYGGLTACSALAVEPAPVSVFPVDRIADAVTAGANRRVMGESEPAANHGELRFVVVPRGQTVSGTVHARQISRQTAVAPDRAVHPKKARAEKVSAPVTTVQDSSAELVPLN